MNSMTQYDHLRRVALYLLCWGEAAQVHFVPEYFCYIFKCVDDYYRSPECQQRMEPIGSLHKDCYQTPVQVYSGPRLRNSGRQIRETGTGRHHRIR